MYLQMSLGGERSYVHVDKTDGKDNPTFHLSLVSKHIYFFFKKLRRLNSN